MDTWRVHSSADISANNMSRYSGSFYIYISRYTLDFLDMMASVCSSANPSFTTAL